VSFCHRRFRFFDEYSAAANSAAAASSAALAAASSASTSGRSRWRRGGSHVTSDARREIYRRNEFVEPNSVLDATGRYRETSPEWFR
jgi:hypothetical protein